MTNTMSARAEVRPPCSAMLAPRAASGSALAFVRLYTARSQPAASSRSASADPIRPVPSQPSRNVRPVLVIWPPLASTASAAIVDHRHQQGQ